MLNLHRFLISSFVFFCVINGGLFKELPDYIHVCKRDPNTLEDCVRKSIEDLRPILKTGIPELNVPGIEPFVIKEVKALTADNTPIRASAKNVVVTGASSFKIKSLSVDLDTLTIKVRLLMPELHFVGQYKVDAHILGHLTGEGDLKANAVKCDVELVFHLQVINKDGKEYIKFKKIDVDVKVKDYKLTLEGLFNGDKTLGEAANAAINQNKGEFFTATKPHMEKTISRDLLEIANNIVEGLTLDQVLPKP